MNDYEYLYEKRKLILEGIRKHKIFKLSKKDAVYCVMVKVGVFSYVFVRAKEDEKQEYLKKIIHTNCTAIDEIEFIQESLKWICRWCSEYCEEKSDHNVKVYADEIYELMGQAYVYEILNKFCYFHSKHIVNYQKIGNVIDFDYINDENYGIYKMYDTLIHTHTIKRESERGLNDRVEKDSELVEMIHRMDFDFNYNFNFGKFTLKDYEEFSVGINNYVFDKMKKSHVVVPGEAGLMSFSRQEWVVLLKRETGLSSEIIESIIDFFMYNFQDKNADLSLSYFFQKDEDKLFLSEYIFLLQRPAVNALRLLAKKQSILYSTEQTVFEDRQKSRVINILGDRYLIANDMTKEQRLRSGMDLIVYDWENMHLQVVELKYKIPIESASDIINLDVMLKKSYCQVLLAKEYVEKNREHILEEYFGSSYHGVTPREIDYFVLTNYSIGTGTGISLPSPIMLEEHYLRIMKLENGMEHVHKALIDKKKKCVGMIKKRYARFSLPGCKFKVPEYLYEGDE